VRGRGLAMDRDSCDNGGRTVLFLIKLEGWRRFVIARLIALVALHVGVERDERDQSRNYELPWLVFSTISIELELELVLL
jgi:hypothetical protein